MESDIVILHKTGMVISGKFYYKKDRCYLKFFFGCGKIKSLDVRRSGRLLSGQHCQTAAGNFRGVCPSKSGEDKHASIL